MVRLRKLLEIRCFYFYNGYRFVDFEGSYYCSLNDFFFGYKIVVFFFLVFLFIDLFFDSLFFIWVIYC